MTNEEKQLLLKDLCARLPYNVRGAVKTTDSNGQEITDDGIINSAFINEHGKAYICIEGMEYELENVKPYLRPMSSMTDKEVNELKMICDEEDLRDECGDVVGTIYGMTLLYGKVEDVYPYNLKIKISPNINYAVSDYLNSHHFDYRGLIEKGLALEAPEGMYNFK